MGNMKIENQKNMQTFMSQIDALNQDGGLNRVYLDNYDATGIHEMTMSVFYDGKWMSMDYVDKKNGVSSEEKEAKESVIKNRNDSLNQRIGFKAPFSKEEYVCRSSTLTADAMRWVITACDGVYDENCWKFVESDFEKALCGADVYQIQFSNKMGFGHMCTVFMDRFVYQSDLVSGKSGYWTVLSDPLDLETSVDEIYEKVTGMSYNDYDYRGDGMVLLVPKKDTPLSVDSKEIQKKAIMV